MSANQRIFFAVLFSVGATLLSLWTLSQLIGAAVGTPFWIFGALCPAMISFFVSRHLVRQSERLRQLHEELVHAHALLRRAAESDQLTGVFNRGGFFERVEALHDDAAGWLLILDIDHFKTINDLHGHDAGDCALREMAAILRRVVRAGDLVGRLGGEEFAIYLPDASRDTASAIAERIRSQISALTIAAGDGAALKMTVSIGLTRAAEHAKIAECLRSADVAMYRAKHNGRNQVVMAG